MERRPRSHSLKARGFGSGGTMTFTAGPVLEAWALVVEPVSGNRRAAVVPLADYPENAAQ